MDFTLPFDLEIAPPPGGAAQSAIGRVSGYAMMVRQEGGKLLVAAERRFWRHDGAGIAQVLASGKAPADDWPEFAPELLVNLAEHAAVGPALPATTALMLDRPDLVDWDDDLLATMLEWPDDRVRTAAILHLHGLR